MMHSVQPKAQIKRLYKEEELLCSLHVVAVVMRTGAQPYRFSVTPLLITVGHNLLLSLAELFSAH